MSYRKEKDSLGEVSVPSRSYWGAQTGRSLKNFKIGKDKFPREFIKALGLVKKSTATANASLGLLPQDKKRFICKAAEEVIRGDLDKEFPLSIWQTGSGTQTHMNVNEVISNRAIELRGGKKGDKSIHPNDDVNLSQSTNDVFPTAMHVAASERTYKELLPSLEDLIQALRKKEKEFQPVIKVGRTHLMDATPLTCGQEVSSWVKALEQERVKIKDSLKSVYELAIGGTAVGTGLNAHPQFAKKVVSLLAQETGIPFKESSNKFESLAFHGPILGLSGSLKELSCALTKIANDIRFLSSGPRCGLEEILLPQLEPGSSIMPGKVNPTQCEALLMVCCQVIGNDAAISLGGLSGNFQLNVHKPLIIFNLLKSIELLSDGLKSFSKNCVSGMKLNKPKIKKYREDSLMLVTALTPHIGYDAASKVAHEAYKNQSTLKKEVLKKGLMSARRFDELMDPSKMIRPKVTKKSKTNKK